MGFSDRLYISKVITKEPDSIEEWLERFIEIILKENSNSNCKDKERRCGKKEKQNQ